MLSAHVEAWLGTQNLDIPLSVRVQLGTDVTPLTLTIIRGEGGPAIKTFDTLPNECASRLRAVSLAIALAIDHTVIERVGVEPAVVERPKDPSESPPPPPNVATFEQTTTASDPTSVTKPKPQPGAQRRTGMAPRFALMGGGAALFDVLPEISLAATLGGEVELDRSWRLRSVGLATQRQAAPIGVGSANTRLIAGRVDACAVVHTARLALDGCLGLGVGSVRAQGSGFTASLSTWRPWAATIGRLQARVSASSRLHVQAGVDGLLTWARPRIHIVNDDQAEVAAHTFSMFGGMTFFELVYTLQ
jgi:hypothetical protein